MSISRFREHRSRPDWWLALSAIGLAVFGIAMILSASAYLAGTTGDVYVFVSKQLVAFAIGLLVMLVLARVDYHLLKSFGGPILIIIFILLLAVFISPVYRGVHRWIHMGPIFFQPAEFVKIGFIIYLSAWCARLGPTIRQFKEGFLAFVAILAAIGGLVMLQPDMGSTVVIILSAVFLIYTAGARISHLALGATVGVALMFLLILAAPYRMERLQTFLNPDADPQGAGYQTNQIEIAIGSGGVWGLGFGQGKLKYLGYVPEVHTDSIFAVVVEELGFLRALFVLGVFGWLVTRGLKIARAAPDSFGRYLAAGIVGLIIVQLVVNLAAMLAIVPLTGITLPFISYGGSSLVTMLAGIGILLSISRFRESAKNSF